MVRVIGSQQCNSKKVEPFRPNWSMISVARCLTLVFVERSSKENIASNSPGWAAIPSQVTSASKGPSQYPFTLCQLGRD